LSEPNFTCGFFPEPTLEQLRSLAASIMGHEGLDSLRVVDGTVRIETAYVLHILNLLCAVIEGREGWAVAYQRILEMSP
jgi:hypothetical protein